MPLEFSYETVKRSAGDLDTIPREGGEDRPSAGHSENKKKRGHRVYQKKYFAVIMFPGPAERINNRAVALARQGKFKSALILLEEAIKEDPAMGAACNNLGIIYEIFNEREKSFELYSRACLLENNNEHFRKNFLYRLDDGRPRKD